MEIAAAEGSIEIVADVVCQIEIVAAVFQMQIAAAAEGWKEMAAARQMEMAAARQMEMAVAEG